LKLFKLFCNFLVVSKKHYIAEKNLSKNLEEKQRIEVENTHKKENVN
jgi:hypothetical protein